MVQYRFLHSRTSVAAREIASRYLAAVGLVVLATIITRRTQPVLEEISPFYFVAVMLSTWFGGVGPGLVATALAGWAGAYYFFDIPKGSGIFGWDDALRLLVFLMVCLLMSSLMHLRRRAEVALRSANETLESRVLARTQELEQSNRLVRQSEVILRALVEGVTDCAICMLDRDGRVTTWNAGAARITGIKGEDILRENYAKFFTGEDRDQDRPEIYLQRARTTGRSEDEGWRVRRDGSLFWAHVIITSLEEAGHPRGFVHVARDITELKRLEKEVLDISETEQRRIGHDLHDGLGQQLTGVAFLTQNLAKRLAAQSLPEAAEAGRISSLVTLAVEQTRELAKGLSPVEWGPDGLVAALRNLATRVREVFAMECELCCDRTVRVESHAAAIHLYRIAQEALNNATRHSKATKLRLSLQLEGEEIVLTVEDNGIGLPAQRGTSSGMGLHLMPYRTRMIGASFHVEPRVGGGTTIRCAYREAKEPGAISGVTGVGGPEPV